MSFPAQVQSQIERVRELQQQLGDTPPAEPSTPNDDTDDDNTNTPTVTQDQYDQLLQRYRTLQGMYNADVPRMRTQLHEKDLQITGLTQRVAALEASKPAAPPSDDQTKYVTEEDEEEYGKALDVMRKAAKEEVASYQARIADLEAKISQLNGVAPTVEELKQHADNMEKKAFWDAIEGAVPDWRKINEDQGFKSWLLEVDSVTGANRQQFLRDAQATRDSRRVIGFFEEWKRITAGTTKPKTTPSAPHTTPRSELEHQISPGPSRASPATTREPKVYTRKDISDFYRDVAAGKYSGRQAERGQIEADIFAAQREGRITQ